MSPDCGLKNGKYTKYSLIFQTLPGAKIFRRQQERYGWEFLFLGANIDAAQEAGRFGIRPECAADYHADSRGTRVIYESLAKAVYQVRTCAAPLQADWKKEIDRDFKGRK